MVNYFLINPIRTVLKIPIITMSGHLRGLEVGWKYSYTDSESSANAQELNRSP